MPLPVVANLYLARLIWQNVAAPRDAINDLYFHDDAGGHTGTDIYNSMNTNVLQNMWALGGASSHVYNVKTTKLDGVAATLDHATGSPAKWSGTAGAADLILAGCQVVTLRTGFRGRSRRGRIYVPWVAESNQTNGTLDATAVGNANTAWETFRAAMKTAGYPLHVCSRLHEDSVEVVSVTVEPYVKSQRRRNRR